MKKDAIFLDRDGTVNEVKTDRVTFVNQPHEFHLLEGVGDAIRRFNQSGWYVFVVTNQGGIGLGYLDEGTLLAIHRKMKDDLSAYGAMVDDIRYCPHKPHDGCDCRKPKPQMITDLADTYGINLDESYMVGDRQPDVDAGKQAGTHTVLLGDHGNNAIRADLRFRDLASFADWLEPGIR